MRKLIALLVAASWILILAHGVSATTTAGEQELRWSAPGAGRAPAATKDESNSRHSAVRDHTVPALGRMPSVALPLASSARGQQRALPRLPGSSRRILHHRSPSPGESDPA